jgi:RND family efflux transporter MFP subunit
MKNNNILIHLLLIGITLSIFGCSNHSTDQGSNAIRVEVEQAKIADGAQDIAYSGTIEESVTIPLSFSSIGTVSQVFVSEGSAVKKGQLLATLDSTTYRNAYAMAHSTEQQAEDAYNRLTPMHKNGNLPEIKYVEVETGLQQAKAAAAIARKSLDDCNLYATTDGFVGRRSIDPGMATVPGIASITLVKIAKVYARVSVPENEIALIKKGNKAKIMIGALGNQVHTGTVEETGVVADPLAHSYRIKIGIENKNLEIKPGMICNVTLENIDAPRGVVVPAGAVMVDETGKNFVYVISSQHRASRKNVITGSLLNNGIEIIDGVQANESVVVKGQHKLVDNALVQIVNN